jgi:hypothetical protein
VGEVCSNESSVSLGGASIGQRSFVTTEGLFFRATPAAAISSWSEQRPEPVVLYSEFSVWSANSSSKWIDFIVEMSCVHAD